MSRTDKAPDTGSQDEEEAAMYEGGQASHVSDDDPTKAFVEREAAALHGVTSYTNGTPIVTQAIGRDGRFGVLPKPTVMPGSRFDSSNGDVRFDFSAPFAVAGMRLIEQTLDEYNNLTDLPEEDLTSFLSKSTIIRCDVPFGMNEEFSRLLEASYHLTLKRIDTPRMAEFIKFAQLNFEKLLIDPSSKEWKEPKILCVWFLCAQFLKLLTAKLAVANTDPELRIPSEFFYIAFLMLTPSVPFHENTRLPYSSLPLSIADADRLEEHTEFNLLSLRAGDKQQHKALILVFAKFDGFVNLRKYMESGKIVLNADPENLEALNRTGRLLASIAIFGNQRILEPLVDYNAKLLHLLENATDAQFRYNEMKAISESQLPDLLVVTKELAVYLFKKNAIDLATFRRLDHLQLKFSLKTIQNGKLAGRTSAIEDLHRILLNVAQTPNYNDRNLILSISLSFDELITWFRKHEVLAALLRDNLHIQTFVERVEKVLQILIRRDEFEVNELDLVWESQWGKHDAVQRNMLHMISKLARCMQPRLIDRLFIRIADSFRSSTSVREKNLQLDFIRNLMANQNVTNPSDINQKAFDLTWELYHDASLAIENIEVLLNVRVAIINSARNPDILRRDGFLKCLDEIRKNTELSIPMFLHIRHCVCDPIERRKKFGTSKTWVTVSRFIGDSIKANFRMSSLIQSENTISVLIDSLANYLVNARQTIEQQLNITNFPIDNADIHVPGSRYTHQFHVNTRLDAILFFICECSERDQYASIPEITKLWKALIENPVSEFDRYRGFNFFGTHLDRFSPYSMLEMFRSCLLKFPPKFFTVLSFNEICVMLKTATADHLSALPYNMPVTGMPDVRNFRNDYLMKARGYLWKVIIEAPDSVAHRAIEFATCEMDDMTDPHRRNAHATQFIDDCFNRLQICDTLMRKDDNADYIDRAAQQAQRVSKALKVLLVRYENNFQNRIHPPLYRACMGRCFPVLILIGRDEGKTKLNEGRKKINVNSNWTMRHFHSQVMQIISMDKSPHQILNMGHMDLFSYQPASGMTATEAQVRVSNLLNSMKHERYPSLNQLALQDVLRLIGRNSMRKTLGELQIDDSTIFAVRFTKSRMDASSYNFVNSMSRGDTPDSSGCELSDTEDEFATDDEYVMPAIILANHQERIYFLMDLADYAHKVGKSNLRDEIANLMDHFSVTVALREEVENAVLTNTLRDKLITASPTRTCFLFQVLHSILTPVVFTETFLKTETSFIATDSIKAFFDIFDGSLFQNGDYYPTIMARIYLSFVRMVKFAAMAFKKIRHAMKVADAPDEAALPVAETRTAQDSFYTIFMLDILRMAFDNVPKEKLFEQANNFEVPMSILKALMFISWSASRCNMNGITSKHAPATFGSVEDNDAMDTSSTLSESSFESSYFDDMNFPRMSDRHDTLCELLALEALDAFVESTNFCPQAVLLFHTPEHLFKGEELIAPTTSSNPSFYEYALDGMLHSTSDVVRTKMSRAFMDMLFLYRLKEPNLPNGPNALAMLDALFVNLPLAEVNWLRAAQYFECLFHLMDYCQRETIYPLEFESKFVQIISWLKAAKEATHETGSTYQREELLVYYLKTATHLLRLAPQSFRAKLGAAGGNDILQELFDDFLMPFCKSYIALEREDYSPVSPSSPMDSEMSIVLAKPNKIMPVCRTEASVSACFALVMDMVRDVPTNLEQTLDHLKEVIYRDITVSITNEAPPQYFQRDSTVFVGLKNAGATCYMNSVIQQLFMIESFRNIILNSKVNLNLAGIHSAIQARSTSATDYGHQLIYSVQNMFAHLLASEEQFFTPGDFWDIFQFGGRDVNVREQQDAVEFFNAFADGLDESLKKINEVPVFEKLFGGTFADQKKCRDCPHMYEKEQLFTSIAVDIRSHNNLRASLNEYVTGDLLEGDNAYFCEECDEKVTAVKRLCIQKLPPYLMFQLKRFDMDWNRGAPIKFFDYFEFPMMLDMEPFTTTGVARREANPNDTPCASEAIMYRLRGVVVHSGEAHGGHYYSYIADNKEDGKQQWYRFDDTDVTAWSYEEVEARVAWFGGYSDLAYPSEKDRRRFSAYMLVYEAITVEGALPGVVPHSPSPPNVPSPNVTTMDMRFGSMSLHSQRSTKNRLPYYWERIVTKDNLRCAYERFQYSPTYFRFIRDVTRFAALQCAEGLATNPILLAQKAMYIFGCFVFSTAIRTPIDFRNSALREWLITAETLFVVPKVANWFLHSFITKGNVLHCTILHCTSNLEVRKFLEQLVVSPLTIALNCADNGPEDLPTEDPESDALVNEVFRKFVTICKSSSVDFFNNGYYLINVLKMVTKNSVRGARRLVNLNALYEMLNFLGSREESRVKSFCRDNPNLFAFITHLFTACTSMQKNAAGVNPYARPSQRPFYVPENAQTWFNCSQNCQRFFYLLIDSPLDIQTTCTLCCYIVYRNRLNTYRLLQALPYHSNGAIAKTALNIMKAVFSIDDGLQTERLRFACIGEPSQKIFGLFTTFSAACIQNKINSILPTLLELRIMLRDDLEFRTKMASVPAVRNHVATLVSYLEKAMDPNSAVTKSIFQYNSAFRDHLPLIRDCHDIYALWLGEMNARQGSIPPTSPAVDEGLGNDESPERANDAGESSTDPVPMGDVDPFSGQTIPLQLLMSMKQQQQRDELYSDEEAEDLDEDEAEDDDDEALMLLEEQEPSNSSKPHVSPNSPIKAGKKRHFDRPLHGGSNSSLPSYEMSMSQPTSRKIRHEQSPHTSPVKFYQFPAEPPPSYDECLSIRSSGGYISPMQVVDNDHDSASSSPLNPHDDPYTGHYHRDDPPPL
uniref:USP domain-containing protein n=1 Tax=Panagrellus redivivus TaxID=6233 RepID=A0A7E4W3S7_PANRE